jgi:hypothetical protein
MKARSSLARGQRQHELGFWSIPENWGDLRAKELKAKPNLQAKAFWFGFFL